MPLAAREIIASVAREQDTTVPDILSRSTLREHVLARWAAVKAIHEEHPTWSLPRIGRALGRHHTTIHHALRKQGLKPARSASPRARPWSDEDNAFLIAEWPRGTGFGFLERRLHRSASSIRRQVDALGLAARPAGTKRRTLTEDDVREIRRSAETGVDLACRFGVSPTNISRIRRGIIWGHVR